MDIYRRQRGAHFSASFSVVNKRNAPILDFVAFLSARYKVKLAVDAQKPLADGQGRETPEAIDNWIDVGVMAEGDKGADRFLFLEKRRITQPQAELDLVVKEKPAPAGIYPINKLIDRNPDDNVAAASMK